MLPLRWLGLVALAAGACAGPRATPTRSHTQIRTEAARAWQCPEHAITIEDEGDTTRVRGCGREALYSSHCPPSGHEPREDALPVNPRGRPQVCRPATPSFD